MVGLLQSMCEQPKKNERCRLPGIPGMSIECDHLVLRRQSPACGMAGSKFHDYRFFHQTKLASANFRFRQFRIVIPGLTIRFDGFGSELDENDAGSGEADSFDGYQSLKMDGRANQMPFHPETLQSGVDDNRRGKS